MCWTSKIFYETSVPELFHSKMFILVLFNGFKIDFSKKIQIMYMESMTEIYTTLVTLVLVVTAENLDHLPWNHRPDVLYLHPFVNTKMKPFFLGRWFGSFSKLYFPLRDVSNRVGNLITSLVTYTGDFRYFTNIEWF